VSRFIKRATWLDANERELSGPASTVFGGVANLLNAADQGTGINVSMQIDGQTLSFVESGGKQQAIVDVLGVALDDRGGFSSFKQKLDIPREVVFAKEGRFIKWTRSLPLPPGLYQVRVAVRDRQTGRTGSAMTWIEIPTRP